MKLLSITESLKRDYLAGEITLKEVAEELHRNGFYNYIPDEETAKKKIGITEGATV